MTDLLTEPLRDGITQRAILELLILAVVCGPLGVWVVLYRQSYATESIAHSMLPGLVIASLVSIPLGLGAAAGLAVAAICIAAASRQRAVGADVAVAVTGIAGPGGGTDAKPVGLVYLHVSAPEGERSADFVFPGDRESIRRRATVTALHVVRRLLQQSRDESA